MKVKMKRTSYGSPDGIRVAEYKKGEMYDLRETLAAIFLKEGWAVKAGKASRRTKDQGAAPENKSAKPPMKRTAKSKSRGGGHGA